jgi:hypothetical protein
MEKCMRKASASWDYFELGNDELFELWANALQKKYFFRLGKCYQGFVSVMKCYIWKVNATGETIKNKCEQNDWIMLGEDKTVTIVKATSISTWNDLILPTISDTYTFLPDPEKIIPK